MSAPQTRSPFAHPPLPFHATAKVTGRCIKDVLLGCIATGSWDVALSLLDTTLRMDANRAHPAEGRILDRKVCTGVLGACTAAGNPDAAMAVLGVMQAARLKVSHATGLQSTIVHTQH